MSSNKKVAIQTADFEFECVFPAAVLLFSANFSRLPGMRGDNSRGAGTQRAGKPGER
jgi:hypothetical protein